MNADRVAARLVQQLLRHGVRGHRLLAGARTLAERYRADPRYADTDARVRALIRSHTWLNSGTGFVSGVGGLVTLPIAVPSALTASWVIHTRLSGAIAALHGYDLDDDRVQSFVLLTLLGDTGKQVLRNAGVSVAHRVVLQGIEAIPARVLSELNQRVGLRLVTTVGGRGAVHLARVAPVAGGVVAGSVDALYCNAVGRRAHAVFGERALAAADGRYD